METRNKTLCIAKNPHEGETSQGRNEVELEGIGRPFALNLKKSQFIYNQPLVKTPIFT